MHGKKRGFLNDPRVKLLQGLLICLLRHAHKLLVHVQVLKIMASLNKDTTLTICKVLCCDILAVLPDWSIYWTLCNFLKPLETIILPLSATVLGNHCKDVKFYHFLVKSLLGNFYRHLAIFFWSHWMWGSRAVATS